MTKYFDSVWAFSPLLSIIKLQQKLQDFLIWCNYISQWKILQLNLFPADFSQNWNLWKAKLYQSEDWNMKN